ncbi:DUF2490 domain-containing protein [Daejeonella lutea]|uniref:DUF2490 domain-containing protein n=1 Tax=Daejeonella lutea TaxID=572036 RepID=A0A1T5E9N7_9SPHI|nr:DUF2490 domain-containing protein [Daejeonella lutea]SKB80802.1 Protein of unknown function [Daejeonella lutea]
MRFFLFIVFFLSISVLGSAQNQIGLIPQINTDFKISDSWKVNAKTEGRQVFLQNPYPDDMNQRQFERLDLEFVATKKLAGQDALGAGYLIRRSKRSFTHRFIQQYSITQKLVGSRLAHRFRTDQTLEKDKSMQFRLRYRLSWEKALNGQEVDAKEFYLKLNNEYLGILQKAEANLEIRGLASLGYNFSDRDQIETGIDYRLEKVLDPLPVHKLFLNVGFYHSF